MTGPVNDEYIKDHPYTGELTGGSSCQYMHRKRVPAGEDVICGQQAMMHANPGSTAGHLIHTFPHAYVARANGSDDDHCAYGIYGRVCGYSRVDHIGVKRNLPVRMADAAQYARAPIPEEQRGQIRVRLLNATPDPLGSIAALGKQYKGEVVRSLSEVTDDERRQYLDDFGKTVLNGPLEAAQFHFQIEGVTRSITHQMVRSRASFFAQESLRFAVPEGDWADEIPLPPWLSGEEDQMTNQQLMAKDRWRISMMEVQSAYAKLIDLGMPAEEARGVLPHDMPTRIHWVLDLRTLLAEAGKRTCTQAQFPWRIIFAGIAAELRSYGAKTEQARRGHGWQFREIADRLRPVCFQTGSCGFMAKFDRSCSIRSRVDAFEKAGIPPERWGTSITIGGSEKIGPIRDWEWAANPSAARS